MTDLTTVATASPVAFGIRVRPADIACQSIAGVTPDDLQLARAEGCTVRQIASAARGEHPGSVVASVGPARVRLDSPFARAEGCQNVVSVLGEFGGETVFVGQGAGGDATAVAVVSDLVAIGGTRRSHGPVSRRAAVAGATSPRGFDRVTRLSGLTL